MPTGINGLSMIKHTLFIVLLVFSLSSCGKSEGIIVDTPQDLSIPVDAFFVHGAVPVIKVLFDEGLELDMLVDTGANVTIVPESLFDLSQSGKVRIPQMCLQNGICYRNVPVLTADSAFTQDRHGYFNGIIGMDLLAWFDLSIDYKNGKVYFSDIQGSPSSDQVNVPFVYINLIPHSSIYLDGMDYNSIILDTGSAYTRITPAIYDALTVKPDILFETVTYNFSNQETVSYVDLDNYCLGDACLSEVLSQIGDWPAVGGSFFREYLTTFKFSERRVVLSHYPDRKHLVQHAAQRLGIQINIYEASDIVLVREQSPAWEAGLKEDDTILSINEMSVDELGYFGVYSLLEDPSVNEFRVVVLGVDGTERSTTILAPM